jgi:signal transduction histidine kinase
MQEGDQVVLDITDNGCGLAAADLRKPRSFGLRGIRERMTSLGGRLELNPVVPTAPDSPCALLSSLRRPDEQQNPNMSPA